MEEYFMENEQNENNQLKTKKDADKTSDHQSIFNAPVGQVKPDHQGGVKQYNNLVNDIISQLEVFKTNEGIKGTDKELLIDSLLKGLKSENELESVKALTAIKDKMSTDSSLASVGQVFMASIKNIDALLESPFLSSVIKQVFPFLAC